MGLKFGKTVYAALAILVLYVTSTLFVGIRGLPFFHTPKKFPLAENIVNRSLSEEERDYLLRKGTTIVRFEFDECEGGCRKIRSLLEDLASSEKEQVFLEEIKVNGLGKSFWVRITNLYKGESNLYSPSENETLDAVCNLMAKPPLTLCALRGV